MDYIAIGKYLKKIRKIHALTQNELADKLSVSRQAVSKWEIGKSIPDVNVLWEISQLFGVTINDILKADISTISSTVFCNNPIKTSKKFFVIGCGRWGSCIAWYLDKIGHDVSLYGKSEAKDIQDLIKYRKNDVIKFSDTLNFTTNINEIYDADYIVISINSQGLQALAEELKALNIQNKKIILCMKGIEIKSGRRLTQIIDDNLDYSNKTAIWVGPGHVQDFYNGIPNCMVIDSNDVLLKHELVNILSSNLIRFYVGCDLVGNEIGAAAKNVIGIAAGMLDGLGRSSLKGPLMARAPREIGKLIKALGGNELSAYGLCHLGDYEATLFSKHSHNRMFGENFVKKVGYDKLAEGYYTVKAIINLAKNHGIDLPICNAVYEIIYFEKDPLLTLEELFKRQLTEEFRD